MENENANVENGVVGEDTHEIKDNETCVNCGAMLTVGQEFCPKCGTPRKKKNVCGKCGAELQEGQEFCPKCGQKVGLSVDNSVASAIDQFNLGVEQKKRKNKVVPIVIAIIVVVAMAAVALFMKGNAGPDFQAIFDTYCDSDWAAVGSDGSYLSVDTNPSDLDDYIDYDALEALYSINAELGLPDSLMEDMSSTTALMGKQSEDFPDQGVSVSWSYHPDMGMEVTYKEY